MNGRSRAWARRAGSLPRVGAVLLAVLAAGCGDQPNGKPGPEGAPPAVFGGRDAAQVLAALPGEDRLVLEQADRVYLMTINPARLVNGRLSPEPERFRGYGVLGKAEITAAGERHELVEAVYRGLKGEGAGPAPRFNPRHAVRYERGERYLDLLICFECTWIHVYGRADDERENRMLFGADVGPVFDRLAQAHALPAPKN